MGDRWLVLQLADGAFPSGGFVHSAGLEAAVKMGEVRGAAGLDAFVAGVLWQAGLGALPFVGAAHATPGALAALDAELDALTTSHVGNRASRAQGRAFAAACARIFASEPASPEAAAPEAVRGGVGPLAVAAIRAIDAAARDRAIRAHHAPVFGAVLGALGIDPQETEALYLHGVLRGVTSAAVRLGLVGPHEAQGRQRAHAATAHAVLAACRDLRPEDAAQPFPMLELLGATQDRLESRLFQS